MLLPKGEPMKRRKLIPLTSYDQVPPDMTEAEAREFWFTHEVTDEYLASAPPGPEDVLPPMRPLQEYGPLLLDREVFRMARWLARRRELSVEELLGQLVQQALAAEEERIRRTRARAASGAERGR
jgi:hypothetical protein